MAKQDVNLKRCACAERGAEMSNARAAIDDEQALAASKLHAGRIAAEFLKGEACDWQGSSNAPEL